MPQPSPVDVYVARLVEDAPPLTPEQVARLATLLGPSSRPEREAA